MLTKTPIKKTTRTTTKTTTQKKGFFKRRFNLQSRKVQFVVVILIVAILGGGWFTYKSFAATVSYSFSDPANNLRCGYHEYSPSCRKFTDSAKGNTTVFGIWNGSFVHTGDQYGNSYITLYDANTYQLCATVKGAGQISLVMMGKDGTFKQPWINLKSFNLNTNGAYQDICAPLKSGSATYPVGPSYGLQAGYTNSLFNVGSMRIELVATPSSPAPAK